jgi:hypothetical protein
MSKLDRFLYAGEKAIFSLARDSPFGAEELAATDTRLVHIKGDKFYDIKYDNLVSLGCYTVYEWKWALAALVSTVTALLISITVFIPLQFNDIKVDVLVNMMSFSASLLLAFAGSMVLAFVITIRRGIIMKTLFDTRTFNYKRSQKKDAYDFVKIVRAAEAGIYKPHKSIKPEVMEPEQRSLEVIKPAKPQLPAKNNMPKL